MSVLDNRSLLLFATKAPVGDQFRTSKTRKGKAGSIRSVLFLLNWLLNPILQRPRSLSYVDFYATWLVLRKKNIGEKRKIV